MTTTPTAWTLLRVDAFCTVLISGSDKGLTSEGIMAGTLTPGFYILASNTAAKRFVDRNFDTIGECVKEVGWSLLVESWESGAMAVALQSNNSSDSSTATLASIQHLQDLQRKVRVQLGENPIVMGEFLKSLFDVSVATWRVAMQLPGKEGAASGGSGGGGFVMPMEVDGLTPGQSMRLAMEMQQMEQLVMQAAAGDGGGAGALIDPSSNKGPVTTSSSSDLPLTPRHAISKRLEETVTFSVATSADDNSGSSVGSVVVSGDSLTYVPPKDGEDNTSVEYVYSMAVLLLQRLSKVFASIYHESINPALKVDTIAIETPLLLLAATTSHQRLLMSNPSAAAGMPRVKFPLMLLDQIAAWASYNLRAPVALTAFQITLQSPDIETGNNKDATSSIATTSTTPPKTKGDIAASYAMLQRLSEVSAKIGLDGATRTTFMSALREAFSAGSVASN